MFKLIVLLAFCGTISKDDLLIINNYQYFSGVKYRHNFNISFKDIVGTKTYIKCSMKISAFFRFTKQARNVNKVLQMQEQENYLDAELF